MKNIRFMRQSTRKRKKRLNAIIKAHMPEGLTEEEIHRIVKRLPLDRQMRITFICEHADRALEGLCLTESEDETCRI